MDPKYEGMYRTRQKKNKVEKHRRTTCHLESTLPSGNGRLACCTSTRTLLTFFACFHLLDGLLIAVGHYSLQRTTTSLKHVEHHIPNYLTATMVSNKSLSFTNLGLSCDLRIHTAPRHRLSSHLITCFNQMGF